MDKRSAKAAKAAMLAKLGASAEKRQRMPASFGLRTAANAKRREAAALQEAIAAGMVKAKGRGKKQRAQKGAPAWAVRVRVRVLPACAVGAPDARMLLACCCAAKSRDKGLQEAGPGFKNGVLRLPKLKKAQQ